MINRLLFSHQKRSQLFIAILGALFGMLLLLCSLQLYFDLTETLSGNSDINQPQYLVINKEVNLLNTLFGGQSGFSENEIVDLKKVKGVKDVAPLTSSYFKVVVTMGGGMQGIPGMSTDLFFEAVPDDFVDVQSDDWQWPNDDSIVPIIIPRDYLKLYNFGFAQTQGLPQIPEGMVGMAKGNVIITGKNGNKNYVGRVVGLSDRINSILTPKSFLDFANEKYAGVEPGAKQSNRVIIRCDGPATNDLVDYFSANGYQTSAESLKNSKLNSFLRIVMNILVLIGSVILILSLLSFFLYSQLLMSRSSYEIETLIRLGYDHKKLGMRYVNYYNMIFLAVYLITIILLYFAKNWFKGYASGKGFDLPDGLSVKAIGYGFLLTFLFVLINSLSVLREMRKLAR
ncbi:MAG TPA: FtsX-like permease family protein [Bacteroidia bacterium]|jgi:hypothetical protein|nr:FtsX-like permease family protein [Bacteroidia bacterium]